MRRCSCDGPSQRTCWRGADEGGVAWRWRGVDDREQALVALFLHGFGELAVHLGGGGVAALRVAEDEGVVELEALDGVDGRLEVLLGLAGEADDDVGGDRDAGPRGFHFLADLDELLVRVGAVHRLEDAVGAALHREMDVRAELRQMGEGGDEVVAVADRDAAR